MTVISGGGGGGGRRKREGKRFGHFLRHTGIVNIFFFCLFFCLMVGGWGNETKVDKITVGWFSDVCKHDPSNVKCK